MTIRRDQYKRLMFSFTLICRSSLDENEPYLSTADSAVKFLPEATKRIDGWKGIEYRAAFPLTKPPGANFYPPDMDKMVHIFTMFDVCFPFFVTHGKKCVSKIL